MLNWYLIYTKQRRENLVADRLRDHGLEVFNPKVTERKTIRRKAKEVTSSLFPNYLFAKFELSENHRLVKYSTGVRTIVGFDSSPTPVNQSIIDTIADRMESGQCRSTASRFAPGDDVEVRGGLFFGLDAVFVNGVSGIERVSILLKEIDARVVIDPALLHKI